MRALRAGTHGSRLKQAGIASLQPNDNSADCIVWNFSWYRRGLIQVPARELQGSNFLVWCGAQINAASGRKSSAAFAGGIPLSSSKKGARI
jgi:hypothetical protein